MVDNITIGLNPSRKKLVFHKKEINHFENNIQKKTTQNESIHSLSIYAFSTTSTSTYPNRLHIIIKLK
jgi:hypothetical protein